MSCLLLFDIDGTLLRTGHAGQTAMEEALQVAFGIEFRECDIPFAGRTDRAIVSEILNWHHVENKPENFQHFQSTYFELLPNHLKHGAGRILPGVQEILDVVNRNSNDWTGLLTGNFETSGWMKVRHFQMDHHFSFGAFGDHHVDRNDLARHAAEVATRRHGETWKTTWVIGDTPHDIRCARAIGARVLAVATGHFSVAELEEHDPDVTLLDLSDVDRVLDVLVG